MIRLTRPQQTFVDIQNARSLQYRLPSFLALLEERDPQGGRLKRDNPIFYDVCNALALWRDGIDMLRISRRTFGKSLAASFGLAFFNPSQFVHSQLFRLFRGKGHETAPITPNADFYVTSYDLTPTVFCSNNGHLPSAGWSTIHGRCPLQILCNVHKPP